MSRRPIARSADLKRLQDEGHDIDTPDGYLVMRGVPYLNAKREIKYGTLAAKLILSDDVTCEPDNHVVIFAGEYPCHKDGSPIERIRSGASDVKIGDIAFSWSFSARPKPSDKYVDYYEKMTAYADILGGPARFIDPDVTAKSFPVVAEIEDDSVFKYADTASSRADIVTVTKKLVLGRIAIVGVGGTGSYVLDLVAKTPVKEIHLFDSDVFLQHNAFRSPGAPSGDELQEKLPKVRYFERIYSKMRHGIVAHPERLEGSNLDLIDTMDFVFLCMEGRGKKEIVARLEEKGIPFIDVGMGVYLAQDTLGGILRTTTSTAKKRDHVAAKRRISYSDTDEKNEYDQNIQIADLNALNAAFAVIKWKKLFGFYMDQEQEHYSTYTIGGNDMNNDDLA
jgi:hypothetical protein